MSARADLIAELTKVGEVLGGEVKDTIEKTLALGDALPDMVLTSLLDTHKKQVADKEASISLDEKIDDLADKLFEKQVEDADVEEDTIADYFKEKLIKSKPSGVWMLRDKTQMKLMVKLMEDARGGARAEAEKQLKPKKKTTKKKGSGTRRVKGETDAWFKNEKEDGEKEYVKGKYACKTDLDALTTYEDNMKVYEVGTNDPRPDKEGELTKDLTKYQFKGVVRDDPIQEEGLARVRCRGAVAWKAGRMGCAFAMENGFKGSVMAQCSEKDTSIDGYCKKCAGKKLDYYDKDNKYKKANIPWCEAFKGECVKIE